MTGPDVDLDNLILRGAEAIDLPAVVRLLEVAGLPATDVEAHLATLVVAVMDGRAIAVGGLETCGPAALLRSLVVTAELRDHGIGRALCDRLEAMARDSGVADIYLLTETAEGFFRARGYTRIERQAAPAAIANTQQFSALCPASAVLMHRRAAAMHPA